MLSHEIGINSTLRARDILIGYFRNNHSKISTDDPISHSEGHVVE